MRSYQLICLCVWAIGSPLAADTIVLRNGNEIQGEIIEETPHRLTVKFIGGTLHLNRRDVAGIKRESRLQFLLDQGEAALRRSDPEEALSIFRQALEESGESAEAQRGVLMAEEKRADQLAESGRFREALEAYQSLLTHAPEHPRAAAAMEKIREEERQARAEETAGLEALARGAASEAAERLRRVYDRVPDRRAPLSRALARALALCGDEALLAHRLEEAERSYLEALSLDPDLVPAVRAGFAQARAARVVALLEGGKLDQAMETVREGLAIAPASEVLMYLKGRTHEWLGQKREAAETYWKVVGGDRPRDFKKELETLQRAAEAKMAKLAGEGQRHETDPRWEEVLPGDWRELETPHFTVRHRNPTIAAEVAASAEEAYDRLRKELECGGDWGKRCTIMLFPTKEEFQQTTGPLGWMGGAHRIRRRFGGLVDHQILSYQLQPRLVGSVIPHEVTHAMLAFRLGYAHEIPLWLNEGFAIQSEPDYVHRYYSRVVSQAAQARALIPLPKLFALEAYPQGEDEVRVFYAESFSVVELLLEERKLAAFIAFSKSIAGAPQSLDRALNDHYRMGLKALEARWLARISR